MKGKLRNQILDDCPENFHDELKAWIDDIESTVQDISNKLEISSVDELHQVSEAKGMVDELMDGLF